MLKTITFAVMHFTIAFAVTYAITGDLVLGGLVAVIEPAANTVAYFFHEKIWQQLQREKHVRHPVQKLSRTLG
ncbi:DUF2061 domain-containing protein [Arsukibacterium sp.]|uniref:DUF2061 domain-containing protein n=1 Tax=Arsukibacterium sp. TaxID=1977258 RepID=UPI001BD24D00|nr:DUF2061 domain-containing protein [Arsukibacterium sp.]